MEIKSLFVGYSSFVSKEGKNLYMINVLITENSDNYVKSSIKDIFVDKDTYFSLLKSIKIFDNITIVRKINSISDKVYYNIK